MLSSLVVMTEVGGNEYGYHYPPPFVCNRLKVCVGQKDDFVYPKKEKKKRERE